MEGKLKVFTGSSNVKLAEDIVKNIGIELGKIKIEKFKDGEISVVIDETVRGYDIYIIQPTSTPVNDNLMELLIMIDAAKRASAGRINAVIPYYGYARQDRKTRGREPISAKLVADLLEMAGADRVISMDLHAGQIQGYFNIPVDHLSAVKTLSKYFKNLVKNQDDWVIVSPDLGGVTRARKFSNFLNLPIAIIEKRRPKPNVSEVMNIIGDIDGKNCIIIDDIIDTAGTITNAANALIDRGAKEVYITASHGVLSGPAIERIDSSVVKKCVITDTIDISNKEKSDKIEIVSVAPIIANVIKNINTNDSVSKLFD
ncbi:ribose-phosphate pyrophosphokinase [Citroniella saccharovorans]|uniref:Ribose-phosphate pyrophosphokinase n=1 Tax=Citroniella saccharovorans TaxID=2053367 RepID=A0AAW9MWG7_9FIRM|nr:ribose-phosphate pyrophosphokinase [Citroniella saccharovorans]MEB3429047.1 ribose-phosphate pyrophosphokinase [Citroniella saccharovorans]